MSPVAHITSCVPSSAFCNRGTLEIERLLHRRQQLAKHSQGAIVSSGCTI
jgi:hypothetical protein